MKNLKSLIAIVAFVVAVAPWMPARMASSQVLSPAISILAAGPGYVATGGNDSNTCNSPAAPCYTINAAIGKASAGDTIYVAEGIYTGEGNEVVRIEKDITLSGGWDDSFASQSLTTIIDGRGYQHEFLLLAW